MSVKNISITDCHNNQIIFQRVYNWKATSAFGNLGKFIECFHQFARTVDDGMVIGVDFDTKQKSSGRQQRDDALRNNRGDTMHMLTVKSADFTVSGFFDLKGRIVASTDDMRRYKVFLHSIRVSFEVLYLQQLRDLRAAYNIHSNNPQEWENIVMDTTVFSDFMHVTDQLAERIFESVDASAPIVDSWLLTSSLHDITIEEEIRQCLNAVQIQIGEFPIVLEPSYMFATKSQDDV